MKEYKDMQKKPSSQKKGGTSRSLYKRGPTIRNRTYRITTKENFDIKSSSENMKANKAHNSLESLLSIVNAPKNPIVQD